MFIGASVVLVSLLMTNFSEGHLVSWKLPSPWINQVRLTLIERTIPWQGEGRAGSQQLEGNCILSLRSKVAYFEEPLLKN